jgi:hypothetical protein
MTIDAIIVRAEIHIQIAGFFIIEAIFYEF